MAQSVPVTVKQGATTIYEDGAAYTVSTSNLTMEVEAVAHALHWIALRGDSQTTHAIILTDSMSLLQKVKNGMGSPDWNVSIADIHLQRLLWIYCPGHARVKGNDSRKTVEQNNPHKWLASWKIWTAEKLKTLAASTKPWISHHWSPGGV